MPDGPPRPPEGFERDADPPLVLDAMPNLELHFGSILVIIWNSFLFLIPVSVGGCGFSELRNMSNSTPSIVPTDDRTVYLVLDDFVDLGQCWRETAIEGTDFETVINDLLGGEYYNPVRVIGFNTAEGWSRDVSGDVAYELRRRCALQLRELPQNILEFVQQHEPRTNRNQQQLV